MNAVEVTKKNRGYYSVNDKVFLTKWEAVHYAKDPSTIKYHWLDEVFSKLDWKVDPEPTVSLAELYRRRAQQLRDKYDYLVVMYSGGPDGKNVLDVFVDNSIHIDEIININSYASTNIIENTVHNADYVNNVVPTLNALKSRPGFNTKITILDEVALIKKHMQWASNTDNEIVVLEQIVHGGINVQLINKQLWTRYVDHLWHKIVNGEKVGIVVGADKPIIMVENNRYTARFSDLAVNNDLAHWDNEFKYLDVVHPFYTSVETTNIIIKQCHILKNFMQSHPDPVYYYNPTNGERPAHACQSKTVNGSLRYDIFHKLIYPTWTPGFVTKKPSMIYRKEDNWWINSLYQPDKKIHEHAFKKMITDFSKVDLHKLLHFINRSSVTQGYYIE